MVSSEKKKQNKPQAQPPGSGTQIQELTISNTSHTVNKSNRGQKSGKQDHLEPLYRYQTQRSSKGSPPLYIMVAGALVLLAGSYVLYISSAARKPWSPVPESGESFEPTPVSVVQTRPPRIEEPAPIHVAPPPKAIVQQPLRPNAVVDVPNVGLRNMPDIAGKASFGGLRRGERVEIVKKMSGKGPAWVKIKTKSGRVGWVFASVVKERKGA
jgi:hypothetical protein